MLARVHGPVALVPRVRTQPVAAREVAAALLALATGPAVGQAPQLAGRDVHDLVDLARQVARVTGQRRPVVPIRLPGATGRALATSILLPTVPGPRGKQTFAAWLADAGGGAGTGAARPDRG